MKRAPLLKPRARPLRRLAEYNDILHLLHGNPKSDHTHLSYSRLVVASILMFLLGVRISEAHLMTKKDIDSLSLHGNVQVFRPKTRSYHVYYTADYGIKLLNESLVKRYVDVVFECNDTIGGDLTPKTFARTFNRYLHRYTETKEIGPISSHSFRIARITTLLNSGIPITTVQQIIGHSDISTTARYYRFSMSSTLLQQINAADAGRMI